MQKCGDSEYKHRLTMGKNRKYKHLETWSPFKHMETGSIKSVSTNICKQRIQTSGNRKYKHLATGSTNIFQQEVQEFVNSGTNHSQSEIT